MPAFRVTFDFVDAFSGVTQRSYTGTFADYATAAAAASDFLVDVRALSTAAVNRYELTEIFEPTPEAAGAASLVFEVVAATMNIGTLKKAALDFPSPDGAIFSGNALLKTNALWTGFTANLEAGKFTISDGEHITGTAKGARKIRSSGKTNLPV